jgi:hypothetical protein
MIWTIMWIYWIQIIIFISAALLLTVTCWTRIIVPTKNWKYIINSINEPKINTFFILWRHLSVNIEIVKIEKLPFHSWHWGFWWSTQHINWLGKYYLQAQYIKILMFWQRFIGALQNKCEP